MMKEDDKLLNKKKKRVKMIFYMKKHSIPLKIFGLYCAVVCKSGGKLCMDVGVESDG